MTAALALTKRWTACLIQAALQCGGGGGGGGGAASEPRIECAIVPVPLDYAAPPGADRETIGLSALRIRSGVGAGRRGSVWVLCGGPGMAQQPEVYGMLYKFLGCDFDIYFVDYRGTCDPSPC